MPRPPRPREQTLAWQCCKGPAAGLALQPQQPGWGAFPSGSWGLGAASAPPTRPAWFLTDEVTHSALLLLSCALRGTDQLSILLSVLWLGIMWVVCFVLAGLHTKGLPQGVFPCGWCPGLGRGVAGRAGGEIPTCPHP